VSQEAISLSPSSLRYAGRLLAVDRPGYAELTDKHAKADGPEGFLEGHLHCAVFLKRVKYPFCIHRVIDVKQHGETLWLFILLGNRVGAHQNVVADCESRMAGGRALIRLEPPGWSTLSAVFAERVGLPLNSLFVFMNLTQAPYRRPLSFRFLFPYFPLLH